MFHTVRAQPTYVELHYRPCDWTSPPPGHCSRPGRPSDSTRIPVLMFRVITFTASALFPLLPSPPLLLLKVNYFHWQNLLQYTSLVSSVNVQAILGTQQRRQLLFIEWESIWIPLWVTCPSIFICVQKRYFLRACAISFFPVTPPTLFITPVVEDFHFIFALALIFYFIWIPSLVLFSAYKKLKREKKISLNYVNVFLWIASLEMRALLLKEKMNLLWFSNVHMLVYKVLSIFF